MSFGGHADELEVDGVCTAAYEDVELSLCEDALKAAANDVGYRERLGLVDGPGLSAFAARA